MSNQMDSHHFRGILLKLQDRLSDDDRKRLHFFLGNDVPRRIRDDPSLGGTLSLLESLFDQDKINEQDFSYLINAFDEIQCIDAVKLLRAHMRQTQASEIKQSVQSLSVLMPSVADLILQDQDDKYSTQSYQTNIYENNDTTVNWLNINNKPMTIANDRRRKSSLSLKEKQPLNGSAMTQKCLIFFVLLSITLIGIIISYCVLVIKLNTKYNTLHEYTNLTQMIHSIGQRQTMYDQAFEYLMIKIKNSRENERQKMEKQYIQKSCLESEAETPSMIVNSSDLFSNELACLAACYQCVEDDFIDSSKQQRIDNCGKMCDCADRCSYLPIQEINKIYGQNNSGQYNKDCFWTIYIQVLNESIPDSFDLDRK